MVRSAPHSSGQLQLGRGDVEGDDSRRALGPRAGHHAETDRTAAGDHDGVVEGQPGAFDGVQRAGQRLDEGGVGRRQIRRDLVHERVRGVDHVARHRPGRPALEAVQVVRCAHVVVTTQAVAALPAGHDLLAGHAVADLDAPPGGGLVVQLHDCSDELVPGDHLGLGPRRPVRVAPELRRPVVALQVAGADADGVHLDQRLAGPGSRHGNLLQRVLLRAVTDHGLHRVGDVSVRGSHGVNLQRRGRVFSGP